MQFELGIFSDGSPEGTRRTELMADGLAAYEIGHVHGATFRTKGVVDSITLPSTAEVVNSTTPIFTGRRSNASVRRHGASISLPQLSRGQR